MIGKRNIRPRSPFHADPLSAAGRPLSPALPPRYPAKPMFVALKNQLVANSLRSFDFYKLFVRHRLHAIRVAPPSPPTTATIPEGLALLSAIPQLLRGPANPRIKTIKNQRLQNSLHSFDFYKLLFSNRLRAIRVQPPLPVALNLKMLASRDEFSVQLLLASAFSALLRIVSSGLESGILNFESLCLRVCRAVATAFHLPLDGSRLHSDLRLDLRLPRLHREETS